MEKGIGIFDGKWIVGYLFVRNNRSYIIKENDCNHICRAVHPDTICRSFEYNGKSFWENDIVLCDGDIGVIHYGFYYNKHYGFYIEWNGRANGYRKDILFWLDKIQVIGNTFDATPIYCKGTVQEKAREIAEEMASNGISQEDIALVLNTISRIQENSHRDN